MVVNAVRFMGEYELLKIRLEVLKDVVDVFLINEADVTFSGQCKPLFFKEAWLHGYDFSEYNIVHQAITDMPFGDDPWVREHHQWLKMLEAIKSLNPDLLFITDADELLCKETIQRCLESNGSKFTIHMELLKFYVNLYDKREYWQKTMACKPKQFSVDKFDRYNLEEAVHISGGGWHFEYMGGRDRLLYKINAISHYREIGGRNFWREIYDCTHDYMGYCRPYDVIGLPREADFLLKNPTWFLTDGQDWLRSRQPLATMMSAYEDKMRLDSGRYFL